MLNKSSLVKSKENLLLPKRLQKISKNELLARDTFGRTILHVIILCNRSDLLRHLLKNPEVRHVLLLTDYESGWNCMHYVVFHKRLMCFKEIMEFLESSSFQSVNSVLQELLKCKDRNRITPFQLLDNDFKDLLWIPDYIGVEDKFHLKYRFTDYKIENKDSNSNNYVFKKIPHDWWHDSRGGSDLLMMGANKHNNLGLGDCSDRVLPCRIQPGSFLNTSGDIETVHGVLKPRFVLVTVTKNHSLMLTLDGSVYSCGMGSKGRLGHGNDDLRDYYTFKQIRFFEGQLNDGFQNPRKKVRYIDASNNHSLVVTFDNKVYTWGSNDFGQLGYTVYQGRLGSNAKRSFEIFEGMPREVLFGELKRNTDKIMGACVSGISSIVYTKNDLFFWGLCIGQMGIGAEPHTTYIDYKVKTNNCKGFIQKTPKRITLRDSIKYVLANEMCTCVVTDNNDILVFYQYQKYKLPKVSSSLNTDRDFHLFRPSKLTQMNEIKKICHRSLEHIVILLNNGDVLGFNLNVQVDQSSGRAFKNVKYTSLWRSFDKDMKVTDIDVSCDGSIILCTRNGSTFIKDLAKSYSSARKSMSEGIIPLPSIKNKFRRLESINRVNRVSCDDNFLSFALIRDEIDVMPMELSKNYSLIDISYLSPLSQKSAFRKQEQLLLKETNRQTYIANCLDANTGANHNETDYILSIERTGILVHEMDDEITEQNSFEHYDRLKIMHDEKHSLNGVAGPLFADTFFHPSGKALLKEIFRLDDMNALKYYMDLFPTRVFYDSFITLSSFPSFEIGFHKAIFIAKSSLFAKIIELAPDEEYITEEGFCCKWDSVKRILNIKSEVNLKAILLFVHQIYSSLPIELINELDLGGVVSKEKKNVIGALNYYMNTFKLTASTSGKLQSRIASLMLQEINVGDITVKLKNGTLNCHSYMLLSRSAYYETLFSLRWENGMDRFTLTYEDLSIGQFMVVLRHLYGVDDLKIFEGTELESLNFWDFMENVFKILEFSNELLLYELKDICQLALKNLITLDNVLILLTYAEHLSAHKLFLACSWFVYNNLDLIMIDQAFRDIPHSVLKRLEILLSFFHKGKLSQNFEGVEECKGFDVISWWYQNSNTLIDCFMDKKDHFNDLFNSDKKGFRRIEPLVDLKLNKGRNSFNRRKDSRGKSISTATVHEELLDLRRLHAEMGNATEETIDESEEVGESRLKNDASILYKSQYAYKTKVDAQKQQLDSNNQTIVISEGTRNLGNEEDDSSFVHANRTNDTSNGFAFVGANIVSCHLDRSSSSDSSKNQPILGCSVADSSAMVLKKSKVKIGPSLRLSQRERKKLALEERSVPPVQPSRESSIKSSSNPWDSTKGNAVVSPFIENLPVLGKPSKDSSSQAFKGTAERILWKSSQERTEELRKTLQDIQQEQKFAKWWEEETARVQKEMHKVNVNDSDRRRSTRKGKEAKNNKKRTGSLRDKS